MSEEEIKSNQEGAEESAQGFTNEEEALSGAQTMLSGLISAISSWEGDAAEQAKLTADEMNKQIADMMNGSETLGYWITSGFQKFQETDDSEADSWAAE